jgi:hypothetical protein
MKSAEFSSPVSTRVHSLFLSLGFPTKQAFTILVEVEKITKLDYNTYCFVEKFNQKDGDKVIFYWTGGNVPAPCCPKKR